MSKPSHLRSLQALDLAVRSGSLASAADLLGITPAAVGQRIKTLEDYLGVELVLRGRAGIVAAPALNDALPHLQAAFAELDRAAEALQLQRAHEIHLFGPPDLLDLWLKPRLIAFGRLYPQVRFCLNGEGEAPIRLGRTDCRIEFGPEDEGEPLFRDYVLPISSPRNVERTATMPPHERLEGFPLLHLDLYRNDQTAPGWSAWIRRHGLARTAPERGIRFQRLSAALDSVLADAGFALAGIAMLREPVEAGRIAFPFPLAMGDWTDGHYRVSFRDDYRGRTPLRHFRDWLLAEAASTRSWLAEMIEP